ncbi:MAG TPA: hypothetical protein PLU54_05815 [Deltaproteobacteria bacterium]|nr:hypothetical protein [Deltaproteobacteria bacterium]
MKHAVWVLLGVVLCAGCAHLEVPRQDLYPFRAEFSAHGTVEGGDVSMRGAIILTSADAGAIQTYGPGGMATVTLEITPDRITMQDMWGRPAGSFDLPLSGLAGLVAGDVPTQAYLARERMGTGTRLVYPWGELCVDEALLPRELRIPAEPPLHVRFEPEAEDLHVEVRRGTDVLWIVFRVIRGGRWTDP